LGVGIVCHKRHNSERLGRFQALPLKDFRGGRA
jgi:hypothetical protein